MRGWRASRTARAHARPAAALLAALLLAAPVLIGGVPAHALARAEIVQVAQLKRGFDPAYLAVDAAARRVYEIGQPESGGLFVAALDADTLEPAGQVEIPGALSGIPIRVAAVDQLRHRMFVPYIRQTVRDVRAHFAIAQIDLLRLQVVGSRALPELLLASTRDNSTSNGIGIKAMTYDARTDGLFLLTQDTTGGQGELNIANHLVAVHRISVERLLNEVTATPLDWSYPVPQCGMAMAREMPSVLVFNEASLYFPCRAGGAPGLVAQPLETPGIVRIQTAGSTGADDPTEFSTQYFPISGNLLWGVVTADPATKRIFVQVEGSATEAVVWVFDTRSTSWLGMTVLPTDFANGGTTSLAVNPSLGRVYAFSRLVAEPTPHMVAVVASSRAKLADQGLLGAFRPSISPVREASAVVDPVSHRIFAHGDGGYLVFEDRTPLRDPPRDPDPDDNTINAPEGEGTGVNYFGGVQAFGARLRWVGGTRGVERNSNLLWDNPPLPRLPMGSLLPNEPSPATRDFHFGRVVQATLTDGEATAKSIGIDRDDETASDFGNWTTYVKRWGGPDMTGSTWPYRVSACTDFGGSEDRRRDEALGATSTCSRDDERVQASGFNESSYRAPNVTVAESRAWTEIRRDPARGVVAVANAEARGIELAGVAGIGRVVSRAETWATGRPKWSSKGVGAGSRYKRTFEQVWVLVDGTRRTVCVTACNVRQTLATLNRALGSRGRAELPEPDKKRARGTRGGYEALVVRDLLDRANEVTVNEERDNRLEVPALVVTLFADGRVRSRAVLSLAGTSAESHYGIYRLARDFPPLPPLPPIDVPLPDFEPEIPRVTLPPPPPLDGAGGDPITQLVRRTVNGLRFLAASPGQAARAFGLWSFLAAPLVLLLRRRALGRQGP